jgi:hypothetical protein
MVNSTTIVTDNYKKNVTPIKWINRNIKVNGHPEYRMVENYNKVEMHVQENIQKVCGFTRSQDIK